MDFQKELLKLNVILNNKYFLAVERNRFVGIAKKFLSTQKLNDAVQELYAYMYRSTGTICVHVQEEYNKAKELMRTCEEDVELNKCEGSCASGTQPSAMDR